MVIQANKFSVVQWKVDEREIAGNGPRSGTTMKGRYFIDFNRYKDREVAVITLEWLYNDAEKIQTITHSKFLVFYKDLSDAEPQIMNILNISLEHLTRAFQSKLPSFSGQKILVALDRADMKRMQREIVERLKLKR